MFTPADLEGRLLNNKWIVQEKIPSGEKSTYAYHYRVEKDDKSFFLKAYDLKKFRYYAVEHKDLLSAKNEFYMMFNHEKKVSEDCRLASIESVLCVLDHGNACDGKDDGYGVSIDIPFLVYQMADSNIQEYLRASDSVSITWKAKSLHSVAKSLMKMHMKQFAHQNISPRKILKRGEETVLGGIGRTRLNDTENPMKDAFIYNSPIYAPPEVLYGYAWGDSLKRSYAIDNYMLGSMILFYFTDVSMTSMLIKNLPKEMHWKDYQGKDVLPHLEDSFTYVLEEIEGYINLEYVRSEIVELLEILCHPNPKQRGYGKFRPFALGNQYSLESIVTKLDVLRKACYTRVGK